MVLFKPASSANSVKPVKESGGKGGYDKKVEMEQAKKNYLLKRFISYYQPTSLK